MPPKTEPRIDAYIEKAQPFAQPILNHIREVVHQACPEVEEKIKWGMPHFDYKGEMMCHMAAFKQHAVMGFWKADLLPSQDLMKEKSAMGVFGKVASVDELPTKKDLTKLIREAMKLNDEGVKVQQKPAAKKGPEAPDYMLKALKSNKSAWEFYSKFSPSQKKEYIEWITDAKTEATQSKRLRL